MKTCSASFSQCTECLISALHPELFSGGCWKPVAAAARDLILVDVDGSAHGKCRFVVGTFSAHLNGLAWGLNELIHLKPLTQFITHMFSINVSYLYNIHKCVFSFFIEHYLLYTFPEKFNRGIKSSPNCSW